MSNRISVTPAEGTWVVRAGGAVIGESANALELVENGYQPVIYFPRGDIAMALLDQTDHTSVCPFKGSATYFSIASNSGTYDNAVWSYETPLDDVAAIKDHLAFYPREGVTVERV